MGVLANFQECMLAKCVIDCFRGHEVIPNSAVQGGVMDRKKPPVGGLMRDEWLAGMAGLPRAGLSYSPAAARKVAARSVRSQVNSGSSRPKWP